VRRGSFSFSRVACDPYLSWRKEYGSQATRLNRIIFAIIFFLAASPLFAAVQTHIRLPLNGYYRSGRYMPVRADALLFPVTFRATGALTTSIDSVGMMDVTVPMLIHGFPHEMTCEGQTIPLHALAEDESLIASSIDATKAASILFPQHKMIPVALNTAYPLSGPPVAWEALDAVVCDATTMARIDDDRRSALLAAGAVLAVPDAGLPDARWPWKLKNGLWVLRYQPLGPADQTINESAYAPTLTWSAGWPATVRNQVLAAGALLAIAVVGVSLWRSKFAIVGLIVIAVTASGATMFWQRSLGIIAQVRGDVIIKGDGLIQRDTWVYERARLDGARTIAWRGYAHPVFASAAQIDQLQMEVHVNDYGVFSFSYQARRGQTIAFAQRTVMPILPVSIDSNGTSPMRDLVRAIYQTPAEHIVGESPATTGRWPGVVLESAVDHH
jgi:hypothetical protein